MIRIRSESGFSLVELLIATGLLLVVSSIVTSALLQMTKSQATIWNRTEMHSGVRGATELLQQEIGQAGRIGIPATMTITKTGGVDPDPQIASGAAQCDPANPSSYAVTGVNVSSVAGVYAQVSPASYMLLTVLDGVNQETIKVAGYSTAATTIDACFTKHHDQGAVLQPMGSFGAGVIPPTGVANGSSGTVLKLFGDVNSDGNMVYVEYTCDTVNHNLYRRMMPWTQDPLNKPLAQILLSGIIPNPTDPTKPLSATNPPPCFVYQTTTMVVQGTSMTFVLNVAITLTVQSQQLDPITKTYQTETKALLNVSPRNVFNAWQMAGIGYTDHIQSTPATITALLQ